MVADVADKRVFASELWLGDELFGFGVGHRIRPLSGCLEIGKLIGGGFCVSNEQIQLGNLGEYYTDMLKLEAFIKNSSLTAQAENLLCTRLYQRTQYRNNVLEHLAWKRQISVEELKKQILTRTAIQLSQNEFIDIDSDE